jgi:hypothetical protein
MRHEPTRKCQQERLVRQSVERAGDVQPEAAASWAGMRADPMAVNFQAPRVAPARVPESVPDRLVVARREVWSASISRTERTRSAACAV